MDFHGYRVFSINEGLQLVGILQFNGSYSNLEHSHGNVYFNLNFHDLIGTHWLIFGAHLLFRSHGTFGLKYTKSAKSVRTLPKLLFNDTFFLV